jgi:type IV secretion system protein VirB1
MQIDFPKTLLKRWNLAEGTLRLKRQPANQREALDWLTYFQSYDIFVDLGLMQVSTAEAKRRGISPETLLEPCANLRIGWQILEDDYRIEQKTHGPGQEALQHAISRYNTGDTRRGIANGYLGRVLAAVRSLSAEPPTEKR